MADHNERLDLAAYALGLLDEADQAAIDAHLRSCADCTSELAGYRAVTDALPHALATESPPVEAWDAIAERIRGQRAPIPPVISRDRWWPSMRVLQPVLLGALVLAVIGLVAWNVVLQTNSDGGEAEAGGRITVYLGAAGSSSEARGQLRMTPDHQLGGLVVRDLPALPEGSAYEVWFVRPDQSRVSGGTFPVDALGQAIVEVEVPQPVEQFEGIGISEEPAGGSPTPTTQDVLAGIIYAE